MPKLSYTIWQRLHLPLNQKRTQISFESIIFLFSFLHSIQSFKLSFGLRSDGRPLFILKQKQQIIRPPFQSFYFIKGGQPYRDCFCNELTRLKTKTIFNLDPAVLRCAIADCSRRGRAQCYDSELQSATDNEIKKIMIYFLSGKFTLMFTIYFN